MGLAKKPEKPKRSRKPKTTHQPVAEVVELGFQGLGVTEVLARIDFVNCPACLKQVLGLFLTYSDADRRLFSRAEVLQLATRAGVSVEDTFLGLDFLESKGLVWRTWSVLPGNSIPTDWYRLSVWEFIFEHSFPQG